MQPWNPRAWMRSKILLVEDDETMLFLLETLFSMEGFEVLRMDHTHSIEQMVDDIQNFMPDIILCDVYLTHLDGFDLLKLLRGNDELKSLRVMMSSGLDFSHRCSEEGADGFILKPYMPEELIKKVRSLLADETTRN